MSEETEYTYRVKLGCGDNRPVQHRVIKRTGKKIRFVEETPKRTVEHFENLQSTWALHFKTHLEALNYCIKRCEAGIRAAENKLRDTKAQLNELVIERELLENLK